MVGQMVWVLGNRQTSETAGAVHHAANYSNTRELGLLIYTEYVYPFELAAVLLLIAIVAAIALTLRRRKDSKSQDVAQQVAVRREDRVRVVQVASEPKAGAPKAGTESGSEAGK